MLTPWTGLSGAAVVLHVMSEGRFKDVVGQEETWKIT